jgi:AcrR family transcriptional regulator
MSIEENESPGAGGKRERTRAALIAATLEVVEAKGFAAASLDAIAARAGMTKGAIYSNFTGKAELMMAAMGARGLRLDPSDYRSGTLRAGLISLASDMAAMIRRAQGEAKFAVEFQLYALGDAELRAGMAETFADAFGQSAEFFAGFADLRPGVSPRHVAVGLQCLAMGLTVQSFVTPGEITDDLVLTALTAFAEGVTAPAG